MVVSFNRGARGQNTLRQLLAPVVKEIMEDKSLIINTSPVDVYKAWVNQLEMQTGEARWVRKLEKLYHTHEESLCSAFLFFLWQIVLYSCSCTPYQSSSSSEILGWDVWQTDALTSSESDPFLVMTFQRQLLNLYKCNRLCHGATLSFSQVFLPTTC